MGSSKLDGRGIFKLKGVAFPTPKIMAILK